tara:strand:+ start:145 stop:498 length:354 start_codon:yes stop_codon:yes gene_type:complete
MSYCWGGDKDELRKSPNDPALVLPIDKDDLQVTHTDITIREFDLGYEFQDTLTLDGGSKGRSSVSFTFVGKNVCKQYEMFFNDFIIMVKENDLKEGRISGTWRFVKKGANIGVQFVK